MAIAFLQRKEKQGDINQSWHYFKHTTLDILSKHCGTTAKGGTRKKRTIWWNDQVKETIREKKALLKKWLKSKETDDYTNYKIARKRTTKIVKQAKEDSWNKYGDILNKLSTHSPRNFYKTIKSMRLRNESFNPSKIVHGLDGKPLLDDLKVKQRWEKYFKDLLNPGTYDEQEIVTATPPPQLCEPQICEPSILEDEVRQVIRRFPNNKSTGFDNIPGESVSINGGKMVNRNIQSSMDRKKGATGLAKVNSHTHLEKQR